MDQKHYRDSETNEELVVIDSELYVEWIVNNYKTFGTKLDFVTDRSSEGNQFCKGFGGIGGLMRYRLEFEMLEEPQEQGDSDSDFM